MTLPLPFPLPDVASLDCAGQEPRTRLHGIAMSFPEAFKGAKVTSGAHLVSTAFERRLRLLTCVLYRP